MRASICRVLVLVASLLGLAGQVAAGGVALPGATSVEQMAAIDAASMMCGTPQGKAPRDRHHRTAPVLAVVASVVAQSALLSAGPAAMAASGFVLVVAAVLPPVRGPPVRPVCAGQPRAPPLFV